MHFSQKKRSLGVLASVALTAASLSLSVVTASAQTLDSEQLAFVSLINNYRAQNGAGALKVSIALQNSSQWMSTDMATKNYLNHTDSLGRAPGTRMAAFGYFYGTWGENIAAGYSRAQDTLNQWISACDPDSAGNCTYAHRANMLNPVYKVMGIGRAYGATSSYKWYWTTDFGAYVDATLNLGSGPTSDTQAPSAPVITSSIARSATEVDLAWSPSSDNVGVAGYQIVRNGAVLTSVAGSTLSYADTSVSGGSTYSYSIKAFDAASNYSPASNTVQVTTPVALAGIAVTSVTPGLGTGSGATFSFNVSDSAGAGRIQTMQIDVAKTLTATGACWIYFMPAYNMVWLANDAATAWIGPANLGSASTLQNSQCSITLTGAHDTTSGNNLTLTLPLSFKTPYKGSNNVYVDAQDNLGQDTNWQLKGTWMVP